LDALTPGKEKRGEGGGGEQTTFSYIILLPLGERKERKEKEEVEKGMFSNR